MAGPISNNQQNSGTRVIGYECDFVEPPPEKYVQSECPVCLEIIREPHQVSCCGKKFCNACIRPIKETNKPCPLCNKKGFSSFADIALQQALNEQKVRCSHKKKGCEWMGTLRELDEHLNTDPQPEKEVDGCQFSIIACIDDCGIQVQRKSIQDHRSNHCSNRPFSCEHCHEYESTYNKVTNNHWPVCEFVPILCPKKCGSTIQRRNQDTHVANECPMRLINCELHFIGCAVIVHQKDMPEHLQDNLSTHLSLLAANYAKQQDKIAQLENDNRLLQIELEPLLQTRPLAMTNFEYHMKTSHWWYSPPVFTHPRGYKVCLGVVANCHSVNKGTYISVYVVFMRGEFDHTLKWPFRGTISYQLLDQVNGANHKISRNIYDNRVKDKFCSRVIEGERSKFGHGYCKFIAHSELEPTYLQNDTLLFQIHN